MVDHDADRRGALSSASHALKVSNSRLDGVSKEKLNDMASDVICAWIIARAQQAHGESAFSTQEAIRDVPDRAPSLEPHIDAVLGDVVQKLDLPWDKPFTEWDKPDAIRFVSCAASLANVSAMVVDEGIKM